MPADPNVYAQFQPNDFAGDIQRGMQMKQLGMQNQQMKLQMQTQQAMRQAYSNNTNPDGTLNKQGFLSDIGKVNPQAALEYQKNFNEMAKQQAETQKAQIEASQQKAGVVASSLDYLNGMPSQDRASAYGKVRQQLISQNVISPQDAPETYDEGWFRQTHELAKQSTPYLNNQKTLAETQHAQAETGKVPSEVAKNWSEVGMAPAKLNAEVYGSRSPNAEITSQYDKQVAPIRSSQLAMQQMYDNYNHPSPQGDASLILNAFKIKFPNAPDVNSLEELSKSQAAPDQWKQWAAHATAGGLDQGTRDNLMRDAASTFRANVDSLKGIQQRYQARAKQANVNDPTLTAEPAIDKTSALVSDLSDKIGPYVPPAQRGGGILGSLKSMFSSGGSQTATAAPPAIKHGTVEDGYIFMGGDPGNKSNWKRAK